MEGVAVRWNWSFYVCVCVCVCVWLFGKPQTSTKQISGFDFFDCIYTTLLYRW